MDTTGQRHHSSEGPDGCGTSETCSACGAVLTILTSQETGELETHALPMQDKGSER